MRTGSGRTWLSALALMAVSGPAVASGTSAGGPDSVSVRRLTDLRAETPPFGWASNFESQPTVTMNGLLYFFTGPRVVDVTDRNLELWATDGTAAGTRSMQHLLPASVTMDFMSLTAVPGRLFFTAWAPDTSGRELWTSDGTAAGTHLTRDIHPTGHGLRMTPPLLALGTSVLFAGEDSTSDTELWKSDGTEAGTVRIKDIVPGHEGSWPSMLGTCGGAALFSATGPEGRELWRTDGTEAGTWRLRDIHPGAGDSHPSAPTAAGGTCFFLADDGQHGRALWKTDGTQAGTRFVTELVPGPTEPAYSQPIALGDFVLFSASSPSGVDLWRTDGTEAGTLLVKSLPPTVVGGPPGLEFARAGDRVYFMNRGASSDKGLWVTDGTEAGTFRVPMPLSYAGGSPQSLTAWGDALVFTVAPNIWARELWRTDGTAQGTYRLARLPSGNRNFSPSRLVPFQDALLVTSADAWTNLGLWRLDRDTTPPVFTCHSNMDVAATGPGGGLVPDPPQFGAQAPFTLRSTHPAGSLLPLDMTAGVSYQVEDARGRVASCSISMTARDLLPPAFLRCPKELTVNARSQGGTTVYYPDIGVTDEMGGDVSVTYSPENGSVLPLGTTRFTVTARDTSGHTSTCTFPVTVRDERSPAPAPACKVSEVRVEAEGPEGAHASWPEQTSSGDSSSNTTVTSSHASGDLFPLGITPVQIKNTDAAGNSRTCEIQVKVRDTRPPVLNCPADIAMETAVLSGTRAEYPLATALDTVSPTQLSYSPEPGSLLSPGEHSVRVTALDAAGNAALCSFQVSVEYDPTSDMQRGLGCSVGSGPASGASWAALLLLGWTLCRRRKGSPSDA